MAYIYLIQKVQGNHMYIDALFQTAEKSSRNMESFRQASNQILNYHQQVFKTTINRTPTKLYQRLVEKYGDEPTKLLVLGQEKYFKNSVKNLQKLISFAQKYPNAIKVIKVASKFGLMMPLITFTKDIISGLNAQVVLGNLLQNILKSVSGTIIASFFSDLGATVGTVIFPVGGGIVGAAVGAVVGYTYGSAAIEILLKYVLEL